MDPGLDEGLRLVKGGDRHADRAGSQLTPRDGGRLVCLEMRSKGDAAASRMVGHRCDIGFEAVEVQDQRRGVQGRPWDAHFVRGISRHAGRRHERSGCNVTVLMPE